MKAALNSKRRQYLARVSTFLIAVALIAGVVGCDGYTPPGEDLEIRDWYDLDAVRDNLDGSYLLMNDLDSTTPGYEELASPTANEGKGWRPIGYGYWGTGWVVLGEVFKGAFDGQGYEIRDLFINRPDRGEVGLFGWVDEGGIIKSISVMNATVASSEGVDGLVALNDDTVRNFDIGTIGHGWAVGVLVGFNDGTVSNSYSNGNVTGGDAVGGLVGWNKDGTVSNSYSSTNVTGEERVGGLVGWNEGIISDSYSTGNVTGYVDIGGLVGLNEDGTVSDSFWDTETSGQSTSAGGTGKTTVEMHDITTFSGVGWDICAVTPGSTNSTYIWNIVNGLTYPFLSWEP